MSDQSRKDRYDLHSRRKRFLGVDKDGALKGLFGGNALASIIILALITIFLFREGAGFFGQYRTSLELYRRSGLEYVEIMKEEQDAYSALNRFLNSIQADHTEILKGKGLDFQAVREELSKHEDFFYDFEDLGYPLSDFVLEANDGLMSERDRYLSARNMLEHKQNLIDAGKVAELDLDVTPGLIRMG